MSEITMPAHHLVGTDLSFTCTNCGGHTSTTPPCIPAKAYPLAPYEEPTVESVIEAAVEETDLEPLYTAAELVTIVGLTYRQVDYWTSTGLLQTKGEIHPGHGHYRGYPEAEFRKAIAIKALLAAGVKLEFLREHIDQFLPTEEGPGSLTVGPVTITYIPEEDTL